MKKGLISFILLIMIFCVSVSAFEVNPGGVGIDAGGNVPTYDIRYTVTHIYLDVTSVSGKTYTLSFLEEDVDTTPNSRAINVYIPRELIEEKLQNEFNVDGKSIIDPILNNEGGKIKSRAKIVIFSRSQLDAKKSLSKATLGVFDQEEGVDNVAKEKFGFGQSDLKNMRDLFNLNIFNLPNSPTPNPPPQPQPPSGNYMSFLASLEGFEDNYDKLYPQQSNPDKFDDILNNDSSWKLTPGNCLGMDSSKPLVIKAGYGIPITAEVQGFHHKPIEYCCCSSSYRNFTLYKDTSEIIITSDLDPYWMTAPPTISGIESLELFGSPPWNWKPGQSWWENQYMRGSLKHNGYPLQKRKLYTNPTQADGLYTITVTANVDATWEEYVYSCYYYSCGKGCTCCACPGEWVSRDENDFTIKPVTLYVKISGSMFDDDGTIIYR